jgi:hypothetical protein
MSPDIEEIEAQALKLSADARARLLDRLILSLDEDRARDAAWDAIAARRDAEVESGRVAILDGQEVLSRLRRQFT